MPKHRNAITRDLTYLTWGSLIGATLGTIASGASAIMLAGTTQLGQVLILKVMPELLMGGAAIGALSGVMIATTGVACLHKINNDNLYKKNQAVLARQQQQIRNQFFYQLDRSILEYKIQSNNSNRRQIKVRR